MYKLVLRLSSLLFILTNSGEYVFAQKNIIITPGVLKVETFYRDSALLSQNMVYIKSLNGRITDSLYIPKGDYSQFTKVIKARAYYPAESFGIMYFDSFPLNNGTYKIYCNGDWYYINYVKNFTKYMTWENFILNVPSFDTAIDNPLRSSPSNKGKILNYDYDNVFFIPLKIKENWVYVELHENERTIDPIGHGWIQWRRGNNLLLKNLYFGI